MRLLRVVLALPAAAVGLLLAVPIVLAAAPLLAVAWLTRGLARLWEPEGRPWNDSAVFEPVVGWKFKPHLDAHGLADDLFHFTTCAEGWRGQRTIEESRIIVVGDSFAFGHAMDEQRYYAALLPHLSVKAVGVNGYNMVQELLWMERLSDRLAGKLVVWWIFLGNDLYENLQPNLGSYRMPFLRRDGDGLWQLTAEHVSPLPWTASTSRRDYYQALAQLCSESPLAERAYSACELLIASARAVCQRAGATLVVQTIPEREQLRAEGIARLAALCRNAATFDPDVPDRRLADICRRLGVPFIPLKDYLDASHYQVRDVHWNAAGHRRAAAALADLSRRYVPGRVSRAAAALERIAADAS